MRSWVTAWAEHHRLARTTSLIAALVTLSASAQTIAETYRGFEAQTWVGLLAPAGTAATILERLHGALAKALSSPEVRERYLAQGSEIVASTPDAFGTWLRSESAKWARIIRERKITLD